MAQVLPMFKRLSGYPGGRRLFSKLIAYKAPYFRSIKPKIEHIEVGQAVVSIEQRRAVQNHIGTIHAIAICNVCELAMGMVAEATIPDGLRWLPKGMTINYLAKARGKITGTATIAPEDFVIGEVDVPIAVRDSDEQLVATCSIKLHITARK